MTKRKRISICILMKLLAASSARLSAVLPITLLVVLLSFSPYTVMQAVERDSLYTFQFVPKQGMLYISYKKNSVELERLLLLIRQHRKDILTGNIPVFISGFCQSVPIDKKNRNLVRERSNRVKAEMILRSGLREDCFRTTNSTSASEEASDVVFVRITLPEDKTTSDTQMIGEEILRSALKDNTAGNKDCNPKEELYTSEVTLYETNPSSADCHSERSEESPLSASANVSDSRVPSSFRGWTLGLNVGIPFLLG